MRAIGRAAGWVGRRLAMRSRWLARRLWIIAAADVALTARRHWRRLDPDERDRLVELTRKSRGRSSRLRARERRELDALLDRLGHVELAASIARTVLPFGFLVRLVERLLGRRPPPDRPTAP